MKLKLLYIALCLSTIVSVSAQSQKELANKYLTKRGELVFTFTANSIDEVRELSRILSFDHGQDHLNPLKIKAYANKKSFSKFLKYALPYEVDAPANEPKNVVMYDKNIHGKGVSGKSAALTFPLETYPKYADYVQQMNDFVTNNPTIARLVNLGSTPGSTAGSHDLLFIVLSDNINLDEAEPRLMYTSSMHGDELAGYPSMLNLIDHLIEAYGDSGNPDYSKAQALINGAEIWINPLANPDGTYRTTNDNVNSAIRGNANVIDLNRNYPAPDGTLHPDGEAYQYETVQFMNLADTYHFVLAANFHGGEEVFNYPWDFTFDRPVDNEWWKLVGTEYAVNAQTDSPIGYTSIGNNGTNDGAEYFDFLKPSSLSTIVGVTHGADWYQIDGGRQDYMNFEKQCREVTIELSHIKISPSPATIGARDDILDMWNYNKNAYIDYLLQGTFGFRGIVQDASTNLPVKARITIVGRDDQPLSRNSWVETDLDGGDFYRLIEAGTYNILIEADCYQSQTLTSKSITNGTTVDLGTISLIPAAASAPSSLTETNITAVAATLNWEDMGVTSYDIQYKESSSATWTPATPISTSTNSLAISGLTANTSYDYQVRSVCGATSSNYSSSSFITSAPSYCNSTGDTSNRGITDVTFNGESTFTNLNSNTTPGYTNYTGIYSSDVNIGQGGYNLSVTVDPGSGNNDLYTRVFIDDNGDSVYDRSYDLGIVSKNPGTLSTIISIPNEAAGAVAGLSRMRISTKQDSYPTSCEPSFSNGEVEDYSLNIVDTSLGIQDELLSTFNIYPNPSNIGEVRLKVPNEIQKFNIVISNALGQKLYYKNLENNGSMIHSIKTEGFKTGVYFVTVSTNLGMATKKVIVE